MGTPGLGLAGTGHCGSSRCKLAQVLPNSPCSPGRGSGGSAVASLPARAPAEPGMTAGLHTKRSTSPSCWCLLCPAPAQGSSEGVPACGRKGGRAAESVSCEGTSSSWQEGVRRALGLSAPSTLGWSAPQPSLPSPETEAPARALQLQMFILHKNSTKWEAVLHPKLWEKKGRPAGRERVKERRGNIQCRPAQ